MTPLLQPPALRQATLGGPVVARGVGLRTGQLRTVTLRPAAPGTGRVFRVGGVHIPAAVENVVDATLATSLGQGGARVALVEHLLAALVGIGVDNVEIEVDGDELPILDGAASAWLGILASVGVRMQNLPVQTWTVSRSVRMEAGASWAELHPSEQFQVDIRVDFPHPAIGPQVFSGVIDGAFGADISWARTFGFYAEAERLRAAGIVHGASLDNTLVFDGAGAMNEGGQRGADEVVRHKALDAVGDLALMPGRPRVKLVAHRGGHRLHHDLLRKAIGEGLITTA